MTLTSALLDPESLSSPFCMYGHLSYPVWQHAKHYQNSTAVTLAMFSCNGGEIVAMTAGEAKDPWKDVPLAMSFVYIVPLSLYPLTLLSAGANVNYADPNLPRLWAMKKFSMSLSPFMIAIQSSS